MLRYSIASFVLIGSLAAAFQDDVGSTLARAEALYYEARFRESIDLLLPVDSALRLQPNRLQEKISVKLQLALSHIGLSETSEAKTRFAELSALDADYSLDPQRFSAKVISVFEEARTEQNVVACRTVCARTDELVGIGNSAALVAQVESTGRNCGCMRATAINAADHYYQTGLDAYKKEDFIGALENFRTVVKLNPQHDLAAGYIALTQDKLRLAADRLFLEWRAKFDAHQFAAASVDFNRIESSNIEGAATEALDRMRSQYRQALSPLVESWTQACARGDAASMESVRRQAAELLPDPAIGQDLVDQMKTCVKESCLQMPAQIALTRLKLRVNPEFPGSVPGGALTVRVKAAINKEGDVTITETQGGTPLMRDAVKNALERWKFLPAIVDGKPRCVETEIPILFRR